MESEANGPQRGSVGAWYLGRRRELDSEQQGAVRITGLGEDTLEAEESSYAGDSMSAWPRGLLVGFILIKAQLPNIEAEQVNDRIPPGLRFHTLSLAAVSGRQKADCCHKRERRNSAVRF